MPRPPGTAAGPAVTRASLQADLLAAHERSVRLSTRVRQLEKRLSEALGEQAWREFGLGAPPDIDALTARITQAEQEAADLRIQLADRDGGAAAARAANRGRPSGPASTTNQKTGDTPKLTFALHVSHTLLSLTTASELRKRGNQVESRTCDSGEGQWWCASMDHCSRTRRARSPAVAWALVKLVTA